MTSRGRRSLIPRPSNDDRRDHRIEAVMVLVEAFMYDLGMLLGRGGDNMEDYVEPVTLAALRAAVAPFTAHSTRFRPDFGEYAEVTIHGDLLDEAGTVTARVDFEDRSTRLTCDGMPLPTRRRRLRVTLLLDPSLRRVLDQRFEAAA